MYTKDSRKTNFGRNISKNFLEDSEKLIAVNSTMSYKEQLKELLNRFTQQELADLLHVTERSVQNYVTEVNPTNPHQKTIRRIREVYEAEILGKDTVASEGELPEVSYRVKRYNKKNGPSQPFMVPLVPVKAQAGYVRAIDQEVFIDTLEQYALPPGVNPHGAIWRYWEVEGESMEPAFHSGDIILTSQVHQMDWENLRNFYLYVVVTSDRVLFKRVYCKNELEWVLISENEEGHPQQLISSEDVKEVWVYRRSIVNKAPPTKMFEIKV